MKQFVVMGLLCLGLAVPLSAKDQGQGFVTVISGQPGAEISIDGQYVSREFVRSYPVSVGDHYVRIEYQGKLMYSKQISVAPDQTVLVNSENFVDLRTNVASRGAIDRESRRLQEVKGNFGLGVIGGIGFPASGLSLKWIPGDVIGIQLSGIGNVELGGTNYTQSGARIILPLGKRVMWNSVLSAYAAPGFARIQQTGKNALKANVYAVGIGIEWAPLDPLYFSGEVSLGYQMGDDGNNQLTSGVSVGMHVFF